MSSLVPTIPEGSLILVTGATGFVASHTVAQLLQRGYKVRGTVRSLEGASWLTDDVFKSAAERGNLELVAVPDLAAPHAFDESIKNVAGIIHVATITDLNPDPNVTVPRTVAGVSTILEAAVKEPSVKEFVYTGSGLAATSSYKGNKIHVGRDTWNDAMVQFAWSPPPYGPDRAFPVYAASKVAAEKEVWRFVDEEKPHFTVNVVSPSGIIGRPLHRKHADSPIAWITHLWNGAAEALKPIYALDAIDVKDVAALHVAATLDPDTKSARLQTWGTSTNWNDMLAILRKLRPGQKFLPDFPDHDYVEVTTDQSESIALLKKWANQDGWRSLEDTIADTISDPYFK